jgi:hypothetical protein
MPDRRVPMQQDHVSANPSGQLLRDVQLETGHVNARSVCASKEHQQFHWAMIVRATVAGRRSPLATRVLLEALQAAVISCNAHWLSTMIKAFDSAMNQQTADVRTCRVLRKVWLPDVVLTAVLSVYLASTILGHAIVELEQPIPTVTRRWLELVFLSVMATMKVIQILPTVSIQMSRLSCATAIM